MRMEVMKMNNKFTSFSCGITNDKQCWPVLVDSVLGAIPYAGATLQNTFAIWRNKNISVARDVLITNIRNGDIAAVHEDELLSMLARFSRSVQEGIAKNNLILLARLITGIGHTDKENTKAETFNQYADMLEGLTFEEIKFLATCIKNDIIPDGYEEIKQSLQFKGFFVSMPDTSVAFKKGTSFPRAPVYANSARTFAEEQALANNNNIYDAKTVNVYHFSSRSTKLLSIYGVSWEDLAK